MHSTAGWFDAERVQLMRGSNIAGAAPGDGEIFFFRTPREESVFTTNLSSI